MRGEDVATVLGYPKTAQAVIANIDEDGRQKIEDLTRLLPDRSSPAN